MTDHDRDTVAAVLAGTPGAFERLVDSHQALVWHIVLRMTGHREDARDLCQDVFLRVHRTLGQFRHECALGTWIGRVAFSVAANALKRKQIPLAEPDDEDDPYAAIGGDASPDLELDDQQRRALVHRCVEALSPMQRTLITLYHLDEMPIRDICTIVGAPEGTVKNALFRARRRLREMLIELLEDPA